MHGTHRTSSYQGILREWAPNYRARYKLCLTHVLELRPFSYAQISIKAVIRCSVILRARSSSLLTPSTLLSLSYPYYLLRIMHIYTFLLTTLAITYNLLLSPYVRATDPPYDPSPYAAVGYITRSVVPAVPFAFKSHFQLPSVLRSTIRPTFSPEEL